MKSSRLLLLCALPLLLTACGLSDQERADYDAVQRAGVPSATYDKMVHDDPLGLADIKALARARVNDGVTLRYLRNHETIYYLSEADVKDLSAAGVSSSVIDYMLQTGHDYPPGVAYPYPVIGIGVDPFWGPYYGGGYYHHHWR